MLLYKCLCELRPGKITSYMTCEDQSVLNPNHTPVVYGSQPTLWQHTSSQTDSTGSMSRNLLQVVGNIYSLESYFKIPSALHICHFPWTAQSVIMHVLIRTIFFQRNYYWALSCSRLQYVCHQSFILTIYTYSIYDLRYNVHKSRSTPSTMFLCIERPNQKLS